MRLMSYRSSVSAPIVVAGILWGAVAIASAEPLPVDTEARLGAFCELVSLAVASAQARADLQRRHAPASSRRATSSAESSSGTSTTERSSGSSRWR